jgi:LPS O-antigen subunit length determinant protein (WzzB/FepE family)
MSKNKSKYNFESGGILIFFFQNIRLLIYVGLAAAIVSGIVSFIIKPKFKSTVIVFPVSSASVSKSVMNTQYTTSKGGDLMNFGEEEQADQFLQVLNSRDLKDMINKKYNLMKHYGIDSVRTKFPFTKYYEWFDGNFSFRRTEYVSIIIEVLDIDKKLAAEMANDVAAFADSILFKMQKERSKKAFELAKKEYEELQSIIKIGDDSLANLRKIGLIDFYDQSIILTRAYYRALRKGQTQLANEIKNKMELVAKYGTTYSRVKDFTNLQRGQLAALFYKYSEAKAEYEQNLPYKYVVESAKVAEKKTYPKRMLIVLASTVVSVFFAFVVLLMASSFKKYY